MDSGRDEKRRVARSSAPGAVAVANDTAAAETPNMVEPGQAGHARMAGARPGGFDDAYEERIRRKEERADARAEARANRRTRQSHHTADHSPTPQPGATPSMPDDAPVKTGFQQQPHPPQQVGAVPTSNNDDLSMRKSQADTQQRRMEAKIAQMEREQESRDSKMEEIRASEGRPSTAHHKEIPESAYSPPPRTSVSARHGGANTGQTIVSGGHHFDRPSGQMPITTADRGVAVAPEVEFGEAEVPLIQDSDLAVAVAIEEDEPAAYLPAAVEYDPDSKPPLMKNRRFRMYFVAGGFCLCVVIILAVLSVVLFKPESKAITSAPTMTPTASPTSAAESIFRSRFAAEVGTEVNEPGTPLFQAAQWIIFDDPMALSPDADNLLQRFLLAFFYFHTTQDGSEWLSCGAPKDGDTDECVLEVFGRDGEDNIVYSQQPGKIRWLSSQSECNWSGVLCAGGENVLGIELFGQGLTGSLPTEIGAFPFLQVFSVAYNEITGTIPPSYSQFRHLLSLEVHGNMLEGAIPDGFFTEESEGLLNFNVGDNMLTGNINTGLGYLTALKGLHLFENFFKGTIPTEIATLQYLTFCRIHANELEGEIPTEVGKLGALSEAWFHSNMFEGNLPSEIGMMGSLSTLRIERTPGITGPIPDEIYGLSRLRRLQLQANDLTGQLSPLIGMLTQLEDLRVSRNRLNGPIPTELGQLTQLRLAWLHLNEMTGSMPTNVCENVGPGLLEFLQTDCFPEANPDVSCICCTACCDRETEECLTIREF